MSEAPTPGDMDGFVMIEPLRCRCWWDLRRCPNAATQEDMLCDWCGQNRPCMGGEGQAHINVNVSPDACWIEGSGQKVLDG